MLVVGIEDSSERSAPFHLDQHALVETLLEELERLHARGLRATEDGLLTVSECSLARPNEGDILSGRPPPVDFGSKSLYPK